MKPRLVHTSSTSKIIEIREVYDQKISDVYETLFSAKFDAGDNLGDVKANSFHSSTSNCTGIIISVNHSKCASPNEAFDQAIFVEQQQDTIQMLDGKLHLSTNMVQKLADAGLCHITLQSLYEKLNMNGLNDIGANCKSTCHHISNSAGEFSPEYSYISNGRNGKQSESQLMTYFSGMCKITNQCESIFRTNALFLTEGIHRAIARTRTRPRENEPLSQRYRLKRETGYKSVS